MPMKAASWQMQAGSMAHWGGRVVMQEDLSRGLVVVLGVSG